LPSRAFAPIPGVAPDDPELPDDALPAEAVPDPDPPPLLATAAMTMITITSASSPPQPRAKNFPARRFLGGG
jgi:hypothetical protein